MEKFVANANNCKLLRKQSRFDSVYAIATMVSNSVGMRGDKKVN